MWSGLSGSMMEPLFFFFFHGSKGNSSPRSLGGGWRWEESQSFLSEKNRRVNDVVVTPLLSTSSPGDITGQRGGLSVQVLRLKESRCSVSSSVHSSSLEWASGDWWSLRFSDTCQGVLKSWMICMLCPLGVLAPSWLPTPTPPGLTMEVWIQVLLPKTEDRNRLGLRSRKMNKQSKWSRIPSFGEYWKQIWASLVTQMAKNLPAMQETWVWFPGLGRSPREENDNPLQYSCLGNGLDWGSKFWFIVIFQMHSEDRHADMLLGNREEHRGRFCSHMLSNLGCICWWNLVSALWFPWLLWILT